MRSLSFDPTFIEHFVLLALNTLPRWLERSNRGFTDNKDHESAMTVQLSIDELHVLELLLFPIAEST